MIPQSTPLHRAVSKGDLTIVQEILRRFAAAQKRAPQGTSFPKQGKSSKSKFLEWPDENQLTALFLAVKLGHLSIVKYLVEEGADAHTSDKEGNNLLHAAVQNKHAKLIPYLIEKNIRFISSKNRHGFYPLEIALENVDLETAKHLFCSTEQNSNWMQAIIFCSYLSVWKKPRPEYLEMFICDYYPNPKERRKAVWQSMRIYQCEAIEKSSLTNNHFCLSGLNLTNNFFYNYLKKLDENARRQISSLDLSRNLFSNMRLDVLLERLPSLRVLNLSHNKEFGVRGWVLSSGAQLLALNLAKNPSLQRLDLTNTGLDDVDFKALAAAVGKNTKLRLMNISNNPALTDAIESDLKTLETNTDCSLTEIKMEANPGLSEALKNRYSLIGARRKEGAVASALKTLGISDPAEQTRFAKMAKFIPPSRLRSMRVNPFESHDYPVRISTAFAPIPSVKTLAAKTEAQKPSVPSMGLEVLHVQLKREQAKLDELIADEKDETSDATSMHRLFMLEDKGTVQAKITALQAEIGNRSKLMVIRKCISNLYEAIHMTIIGLEAIIDRQEIKDKNGELPSIIKSIGLWHTHVVDRLKDKSDLEELLEELDKLFSIFKYLLPVHSPFVRKNAVVHAEIEKIQTSLTDAIKQLKDTYEKEYWHVCDKKQHKAKVLAIVKNSLYQTFQSYKAATLTHEINIFPRKNLTTGEEVASIVKTALGLACTFAFPFVGGAIKGLLAPHLSGESTLLEKLKDLPVGEMVTKAIEIVRSIAGLCGDESGGLFQPIIDGFYTLTGTLTIEKRLKLLATNFSGTSGQGKAQRLAEAFVYFYRDAIVKLTPFESGVFAAEIDKHVRRFLMESDPKQYAEQELIDWMVHVPMTSKRNLKLSKKSNTVPLPFLIQRAGLICLDAEGNTVRFNIGLQVNDGKEGEIKWVETDGEAYRYRQADQRLLEEINGLIKAWEDSDEPDDVISFGRFRIRRETLLRLKYAGALYNG